MEPRAGSGDGAVLKDPLRRLICLSSGVQEKGDAPCCAWGKEKNPRGAPVYLESAKAAKRIAATDKAHVTRLLMRRPLLSWLFV